MTYLDIRDNFIKPKLTDMLGKTMANNLSDKAHIQTITNSAEYQKLRAFLDTVCTHDHFIGMWGTAQADKQKREWLGLMR